MATTKKKPAAKKKAAPKKVAPELVHEDGQWYIISGTKRLDVGRNERLARSILADMQ